jgi:DNA-directed RNA polymerase specialized sigma24 family protein
MLADYLRRLPEEQKAVVIMKEYDNMKFREIAADTGYFRKYS